MLAGADAPLFDKSEHGPRLKPWFRKMQSQMLLTQQLLASRKLDEATHDLEGQIIEASRDMTQFIARLKQIRDQAAEHNRKGGVDEFNRPFNLKGDDLDKTVSLYEELEWGSHTSGGSLRQKVNGSKNNKKIRRYRVRTSKECIAMLVYRRKKWPKHVTAQSLMNKMTGNAQGCPSRDKPGKNICRFAEADQPGTEARQDRSKDARRSGSVSGVDVRCCAKK